MPASFASLPSHERQAFFSLLDEYFASRPYLMPNVSDAGDDGQPDEASTSTYTPAPTSAIRNAQPPPAPAARKPSTTASSHAAHTPSGLSTGKSMGRLDMSSKGAAFGSMIMGQKRPEPPKTAGEAITGPTRATSSSATSSHVRSPPPPAPRSVPAPPPPREPDLGHAEVLYDYNGGEAEDLVVKRFEVITLTEKISEDWWKAKANDGRTGIVPSTYVKQL